MKKEKTDKSILEESLIDFQAITKMIGKTSESTIKSTIDEAVKKGLKNIISEANDFDDDEDDLESGKDTEQGLDDTNPESEEGLEGENEPEADVDVDVDADGDGMEPEADVNIDVDADGEGEEDFDMDSFKTGDDEYDLTNSDINDVVKVFKKIDDNDSIIVKKLEQGKVELIDKEANTDYLIDMSGDGEGELEDGLGEEGLGDDLGSDLGEEGLGEEEFTGLEGDVNEEDNSLDEDVEVELEGAEDAVDENMTTSLKRNNEFTTPQNRIEYGNNKRQRGQLVTNESELKEAYSKAYGKKIKLIEQAYAKKFEAINEEVSQYKQALTMFRDKLKENAVLNNNLAKYVKLVTENATTKTEKLQILERFSKEANTIEKGNNLFESINKDLNKKNPELGVTIDKKFSVEAPKQINEQVIYQSKDLQDTIGLINRMKNLR